MINSGSNKTQKNNNQDEVEVIVRNLPNEVRTEDILEYLSVAGPIKSCKFTK